MTELPGDVMNDHEALIQFLYIAPVGLLQASIDGDIALINPVAAQLLMPLVADASLTNLFATLRDVAPDLRCRTADFAAAQGTICNALRLPVSSAFGSQVLSLTLLKLDACRVMAMISDVTDAVLREGRLLRGEAGGDAALNDVHDHGASDHAAGDPLTGIANRRALFAAIDIELTRSRRTGRALSLAFFEVDDFDGLVARDGRAGGDAVLRHVASLLSSTFREVDVPARIADARFAVLVSSPLLARVTAVAERLRRSALARPLVTGRGSIACSVTAGVVTVEPGTIDPQTLMTLGAAALAASRAAGTDRIEIGLHTDRGAAPVRSAEHLS